MKRMITTKKARAQKILSLFDPQAVQFVREYKDEVDNLIEVEYDEELEDWIEVDPTETIRQIAYQYVRVGIDEDLIDSYEDLETIYEALCEVEGENGDFPEED